MNKLAILLLTFALLATCKNDDDTSTEPNYFSFTGKIGTNDNSTIISGDDNLIICGNNGDSISVLKITKTGSQIWRSDFFSGYYSNAFGIIEINDDIFICGQTARNHSVSKTDVLLIKVSPSGDTLWTKTYGGTEAEYGACIIPTSDGNILIAGKTESFGANTWGDFYLVKVNTSGDTLWTKSYPDQDQEVPYHVIETQNGEYLVTGTNEDESGPKELYLLKVSANGTPMWNKKIGPATWMWGYTTIELADGNLLTCGQQTKSDYSQILLIKTDYLGNVIWEREFGESNISETGYSIKENADKTFTITGSSYDVTKMQSDIILVKVDQNGNQLWFKKFGSLEDDSGVNLIKNSNDDNIITGDYNGSIFMTVTDSDGDFK